LRETAQKNNATEETLCVVCTILWCNTVHNTTHRHEPSHWSTLSDICHLTHHSLPRH